MNRLVIAVLCVCAMAVSSPSRASSIFLDDFESGALNPLVWTGLGGAAGPGTSAQVLQDPYDSSNNVINFQALGSGGDLFSVMAFAPGQYWLSFDYLGFPGNGSERPSGLSAAAVASDSGGFIGVSPGFGPVGESWLADTSPDFITPVSLIDDGTWNTYVIPFVFASSFQLKLQDWVGSNPRTEDAFFDNIQLFDADPNGASPVPEPGTLLLMASAGAGAVVRRRRRRA